jgi:hypothetical protein
MKNEHYYSNFRGFEKITVFKISINEGDGTLADPITRIHYYMTEDGELIGSTKDIKRKFVLDK